MTTTDAEIYYTKPLETWTFAELTEAIGFQESADLLGMSLRNIYTHRSRGSASVDRMRALCAHIRNDEATFRETLVALKTGRYVRGRVRARTKTPN